MPATGPSTLPSTSPAASAGAKIDPPVKQIALCMAAPASHNMVTISTTAQARPSASASIVTGPSVSTSGSAVSTAGAANFLQATGSANASAAGIPGITQLGLMVTRFASSDRHQTVLFQPRAPGRQAVVVSTPNPALGQRIVQIPNTTIRTIVQAGGASGAQTVQGSHSTPGLHVNITPVSNPTQPTVVKSTGISNTASTRNLNIPIESGIGIVVANDGANSRQQFRIHPQDMISVKSAQLNPASVKVARSPSASVTPAKVINLTSPSNVVNSTTSLPNSNVARLGIIQSGGSGSNNKTGSIISVTMPKNQAVIINPQGGHQTTANFASNQTTHARPAIIPVNQVLTTITGQVPRHAIISAGSSTTGTQSSLTTQRIITTQHVQPQPNITISGSSPIKSGMTTSPIKQSIPTATPPSPRPSILTRKRNITDTHSSQGSSNSCSQQTKSSTITPSTPVKAEQNIVETERTDVATDATDCLLESSSPNISSQTSTQNEGVTTPRKRTRKQLLEPFNPTKTPNIRLLPSTSEENTQAPPNRMVIDPIYSEVQSSIQSNRSDEDEQMDSDEASQEDPEESTIIMPSNTNRPRLSMLNQCALPSKSLQYHFLRYSDVKPKPEKKLTLSELSNQVLQKKNGWKIHHLATQLEDTSSNEAEILERLQKILELFEQELSKLPMDEELPLASGSNRLPVKVSLRDRLSDLIRGNIQRSLLYQDQSTESRQLLIKLTNDHREKVAKLTKKNLNKRTCISK